jgi:hypothetical protein
MPLMRRAHSLQMSWCLDCHEHPQRHVRKKDDIYKFGNAKETVSPGEARSLMAKYKIDPAPLLDCWICHR